MIIYKVTNIINGKVYIGQTTLSLKERQQSHKRESENPKRKTVYFHNALLKYGFDSFIWEEIDTAITQEELDEKEVYWISYYNSTDKTKGYNLKAGGLGGGKNSKETLEKIGETTKQKWADPVIAEKMLAGLRKGTETQKNKAENNWKETTCIVCGNIIRYRPKDHKKPKFCSDECKDDYMKEARLSNLLQANRLNQSKYNLIAEKTIRIVSTWAMTKLLIISSPTIKNIFSELKKITNIKDERTIMKPFGFTSRRLFVQFLLKMYADQV